MQLQPQHLLAQFARLFAPMRQERGRQLFASRYARITEIDREKPEFLGTVRDPADHRRDEHTVSLEPLGRALEVSCTCMGAEYCEHAFALLLQLDRIGSHGDRQPEPAAPTPPSRSGTTFAPAAPAVAAQQSRDRQQRKKPEPAPVRSPAPPAKGAPATGAVAPQPGWRERLDEAEAERGDAPHPPPIANDGETAVPISFVVDLQASRGAGILVVGAMQPQTIDGQLVLAARGADDREPKVSAADHRALRLLGAMNADGPAHVGFYCVPGAFHGTILPLLAREGRLYRAETTKDRSSPLQRLAWDGGAPFRLTTAPERTSAGLAVHGALRRGGETILPEAVALLLGPDAGGGSFAIARDRIVAVDLAAGLPLARMLLEDGPLRAPAEEADDLLRRVVDLALGDRGIDPPVPTRRAPEPTAVLVVHLKKPLQKHVMAELQFDYGRHLVGLDEAKVLAADSDGTWLLRDADAERRLERAFLDTHARKLEATNMPGCFLLPRKTVLAEITRLVADGLRVLADGKPMLPSAKVSVSVATKIDWFDVRGEVTFVDGSSLPLAKALLACKRGERFVELGDGRTGVLPEELLQRWANVLELGEAHEGGVRVQRGQALLLDALLTSREGAEFAVDGGFRALREQLADFAGIAPRAAPEGFAGTLRDYQSTGLAWLWFLRELRLGGCLADDMGLGKTVQVLALLAEVHRDRSRPPSLLVAPRSLIDNWRREAERFAPALRVLDFAGPSRWDRGGAAALGEHDLILTTYGTLRSDVARFVDEGIAFEYAILDEAQAVENAQSLTSKAVRLVRAEHRLALTGTPVQNHIGELWALFEFLSPGLLGRSTTFQRLVADSKRRPTAQPGADTDGSDASERGSAPGKRGKGKGGAGRNVGEDAADGGAPDGDRERRLDTELLRKALAPFLLRRTKEQVLAELPPKQEQTIRCELDQVQRRAYDSLRQHYRDVLLNGAAPLDNKQRFVALEALLRLRQVACHPSLVDGGSADRPSAKLDALLPMLKEIAESGHKALVFSQFTEFLALVRARLEREGIACEYLDGQTRKRQQCVDRFQTDPQCPVFLISLKAGGFGLNLTAADYVFLLDPWWNPAAEAQAVDRAHRMGQTQKVTAYRLVAQDTVEEKVLQLQAEKRALADAVLGGDGSVLQGLTRDDLALILA